MLPPLQKADKSMTMPGGIRRRVRALQHVPVITAPLEVCKRAALYTKCSDGHREGTSDGSI